jgi:hypothetical protein
MVDSFPSNSHTAKPMQEEPSAAKPKLEKVVTGEVQQRKQSLGKRMTETFLGGDARSVANYVLFDVLVPAAKDMFSDAVSQGFDRMLWGEGARGSRRGARSISEPRGGHVSYNRMAQNTRREDPRTPMSRQARTNHDFDEILLATRIEADTVLERMFDLINQYQVVSVHDLYELVGQTPSFTDAQWGWDELLGARVVRDGGGYLLDLPKPKPIK